jgi:hypothetical protein
MRVPEEPVCIELFRQNPVFTSLHLKSPVHVRRLRDQLFPSTDPGGGGVRPPNFLNSVPIHACVPVRVCTKSQFFLLH